MRGVAFGVVLGVVGCGGRVSVEADASAPADTLPDTTVGAFEIRKANGVDRNDRDIAGISTKAMIPNNR